MEFGVQIEPQFGFTYEAVTTIAREAEQAGYTHLWVTDHFFLAPAEPDRPCLEAWTLLAALSQRTTRLRLGPLVTAQSYRQPSLLAKMAATVDVMSGGRLEFGIGTGWKEAEYLAYGYPFPPAPERVEQLQDALEIVRAMWTQERATVRGRHYQVHEAVCAPKPVQRPHPPILVGARRPRVLALAARYADAVNIPEFFLDPAAYATYLRTLEAACRRIGRDPATIRKTHSTYTVVGRTRAEVEALVDELLRGRGLSPEETARRLRGGTVGTPDAVRERLAAYRALGIAQVIFLFPYGREREMLGLLAEEVLPALTTARA